ncbi:MAG TPA: chorismate mutase [Nanoarchaeota archaeon]|nr:chorismate mutase [Nanoarchaeota archaeon]
MELKQAREEIDKIDNEILQLAAKRLGIAKEIAEIKQKLNLPLGDRERESELLQARIEKMQELGFEDKEFVRQLFAILMKKSKEIQTETMENK